MSTVRYRKIGAGACGAVFAQDRSPVVCKVSKVNDDSLCNEFQMHSIIRKSLLKFPGIDIDIPRLHYFIPHGDTDFAAHHPELTAAVTGVCALPAAVLASERISPLSKEVQCTLIEAYCPARAKRKAFANAANRDSLAHVYLGYDNAKARRKCFCLRDFRANFSQLMESEIDMELLAVKLAKTLAVMHWDAKTDARGVKFALGGEDKDVAVRFEEDLDFFEYKASLWVLDFDQVQSITPDEAGVAKAVEAVRLNDPYFPRPLQGTALEKVLWQSFVSAYLETACSILGRSRLPMLFIDGLVELEAEKQRRHTT